MTNEENTRQPRNDYQLGFIKGAEWKEKEMIEKAVEWLENNVIMNGAFYCSAFKKEDIESLKQAMKGE